MADSSVYINKVPTFASSNIESNLGNRFTAAHQLIDAATTDPEISAILERVGYGRERLAQGQKLYRNAQMAFVVRQGALAQLKYNHALLEQSEAVARHVYGEFRSVARLIFRTGIARIDLGLEGQEPEDLDKFMIVSRSVLTMARRTPSYRNRLVEYGSLDCLEAALEDLRVAARARDDGLANVLQSTQRWDKVMVALEEWVDQLCKSLRRDLRNRPDLLIRLGL